MNELKDDMEDLHSNLDDLNNWVDGANQEMDDVRRSIAAMDNTDGLLDSFKVSTGAGMGGVGWGGVGISMMTSSNGNIFRVTGPLCGEFTGHR